jgi:uncharacterized cupredoxin-like copper-binding protein
VSTVSRMVAGLIGVLLLMAVGIGCSSDGDDAVPADAQRVTVTMGDSLAFDQPTLTVQAGKPVLLTIKSTGQTDHDFTVMGMPATNVKNDTKGRDGHGHNQAGEVVGHPRKGGEVTIRFTPTTPGTYEFYCSVTGHKDAGMRGVLTVT